MHSLWCSKELERHALMRLDWRLVGVKRHARGRCVYSLEVGFPRKIYGQFVTVIDHVHSEASFSTIACTPLLAQRPNLCLKKAKTQHISSIVYLVIDWYIRSPILLMSSASVASSSSTLNFQFFKAHCVGALNSC